MMPAAGTHRIAVLEIFAALLQIGCPVVDTAIARLKVDGQVVVVSGMQMLFTHNWSSPLHSALTRLLRAAMYGWRLAAVSLSVRRQATLRVCEQHRARADDAAKREALRLWRSAEEHRAQWRNAQAAGVARLHRRRRAKWLGALVGGWRRLASRSVLQRQLALAQAMHFLL